MGGGGEGGSLEVKELSEIWLNSCKHAKLNYQWVSKPALDYLHKTQIIIISFIRSMLVNILLDTLLIDLLELSTSSYVLLNYYNIQ